MNATLESFADSGFVAFKLGLYVFIGVLTLSLLKVLYNISPFHPLAKYPGPLLWRATRMFAAYHQARGDLYKCITAIHIEYGPTVRVAPDELSFTSPDAWNQIFNSKPQLPKTQFHYTPADLAQLPESMIMATDTEHARLRRLTGSAFLNTAVSDLEPTIQLHTDRLCSLLAKDSRGGSQDIGAWFLWTLSDVIGQLALGAEFECLEKRRMHEWPGFLMSILKQSALVNQFRRYGLSMKVLGALMSQKMLEEKETFFNTAATLIDKRLEEGAQTDVLSSEKAQQKRPDLVEILMRETKGGDRLAKDEIATNAILFVAAGAETTSTCLTAAIYFLCKTPRVMKKLREEIRQTFATPDQITFRAVSDMPYLKATIDESLRIFPVGSYFTPRLTPKEGHLVNGEHIPGNTYVAMDQWYMGRSGMHYDNSEEFQPERWLDLNHKGPSGRSADDVLKPFSLGPRNCIGKQLALTEARLVLAKLLWHFDIELDGEHKTWVDDARFYVLWQLKPLNVRVTPVQ